ncbi:MAG TPA: phosphatase PAP2 family protein, partial [Thermoanaerobaculia bacterium]|nr:phosphatase PAP2 family protein [Thermoanaerobaculia bacterium]
MTFTLSFLLLFVLLWLFFFAAGPALERLLARAAHWTAKFRYRDYLPVFVALGAGIIAAMLAGDAFVDLAESLQEDSPRLHAIDAEVHEWARTTRTAGSTAFFTIMTLIGTPVGLGLIAVVVAAALAMRGRWRWAAYLFFTSGVGGLLNLQLKAWFARARPELAEALRDAHGYSFPSGHAMGSTIVFGALAYLAFRIVTRWRWRAAALALACTMIVAIAASRIYLGVHWISDVAAGIAAGVIWLVTTTVAYEAFRRIRLVRALRA